MSSINANVGNMRKDARKILKIANELNDCVKEYENVLQKLEKSWTGVDSNSTIKKMRENHEENLKKYNKCLRQYGVYITNVVTLYNIVDNISCYKTIK